jgi:antitoxin component YwqK of YwqJK toxin-antitoxin module
MMGVNTYTAVTGCLFLILLVAGCTSTHSEYWPDGSLKSSVEMKGSLYHGNAIYYFENGNPQVRCTYSDNLLDGLYTIYYNDGKRKEEISYKKGILDGPSMLWDINGAVIRICGYRNGRLHGKYTDYYPNGTVKTSGGYLDGLFNGLWIYSDESGTVVGEGRFDHGTGVQKAFFADGALKQQTLYKDNRKEGREDFYDPGRKLVKSNHYENGKLIRVEEYE